MIALDPSTLGVETLDRPDCPADVARATLRDLTRVNALFGGCGAAASGFDALLRQGRARRLTLLDVGAGAGDVARHLAWRARAAGVTLIPVALDLSRIAAALARDAGTAAVVASAGAVPCRDRGVDIVLASQFLHHFTRATTVRLVRAFDRLARFGVIVCELRRTPVAAMGIRAAARVLRLHAVTGRDGALSVRRGFTRAELAAVLAHAGVPATVSRRPGFRLVAAWSTGAHR